MPRLIPAILIACTATACGMSPARTRAAASAGGSAQDALDAGSTPPRAPAPKSTGKPRCARGERRWQLVEGSTVSWIVVKGTGAPVVGTHPARGELSLSGRSTSLSSASLALSFDLDGDLSGIPLRDERLRRVVFGADEGHTLAFRVTGVSAPDGAPPLGAFPTVGTVVPLLLDGLLSIADTAVPVEIPVLLAVTATGLRVTEGLDGVTLDLRRQLGLGDSVDTLLSLVTDVSIDDALRLRFALDLEDACS